MFSSSLRSRPTWAPVVPVLTRSHIGWRETTVDGYDIAFQAANNDGNHLFRLIVLVSDELGNAATSAKIERLRYLDGGRQIGVILLLREEHGMAAYAQLQADLLKNGCLVPIVPILKPEELPACLADWRRQLSDPAPRPKPSEMPRTLVSHCVHGPRLDERQTNILMDVCSGFRELARNVHDPEKLHQMADYLGQRDAERVADFMRGGPRAVDM